MTIASHFSIDAQPVANPEAIVQRGQYRFTILTTRLIRIEHSETGDFVDQASQIIWHREQPLPTFTVADHDADSLVLIATEHLALSCYIDRPPSGQTLFITLKQTDALWHYGDTDTHNLGGTLRTLDGIDGAAPLEKGLLSQSGWAVITDESLLFNDDSWLEARHAAALDLYFFGYGHDYEACLQDYLKIAGPVPLIPRWALGNWWSRYHPYSQDELQALIDDFAAYDIPLSVLIIDMDWHITDTGNASNGWTGYTWNEQLFPDADGLLAYAHQKRLKVSLNLHPADGVWPHEAAYDALAQRLGHDTRNGDPINFDIADPQYALAYFEELHHPLEARGIDFWWMDWQQGYDSSIPGLDPLWWLNHLHAYDIARDDQKRRFVFSRWGGLGNHRYPIGFSGDAQITWASLDFQPYLTSTAANVGFGWWSHDIGGHYKGTDDPELFTRWVQYGVFSPILRLHTVKGAMLDRRPWTFDRHHSQIIADAMRLRHALVPYLYSEARKFYATGVPPIRPMYYEHPEADAAYACPQQYYFGDLIAAPFTHPADPDTRLSRQVVWLPAGDWYDFFSGQPYSGGRWHVIYGTLEDMPVFAKAGAIIPMNPDDSANGVDNPQTVQLKVFGDVAGEYVLYEDDGESTAYRDGRYSETRITRSRKDGQWSFEVSVEGETAHLPAKRQWTVDNPTPTVPDRLTRLVQMLRRMRLGNELKQVLYNEGAYHDMARLAELAPWLTRSQRRALLEAYYDAGVHVTRDKHEKEQLVIWNDSDAVISYRYAVLAHFREFKSESGTLQSGEARVIVPSPKQSRHYNVTVRNSLRWQITLTYPNGMSVTEMGAADTPRLLYNDL